MTFHLKFHEGSSMPSCKTRKEKRMNTFSVEKSSPVKERTQLKLKNQLLVFIAACAAASLAIGTLNGEQDT